jgi:hypothetical protein
MEHEKFSRKPKSERVTSTSMRVMLYHYDKKYKAGDRITIETDSKKYLDQAKKDYASRRKNKKIKKKPS